MTSATKPSDSVSSAEILWSWLGAFLGIATVAYLDERLQPGTDLVWLIGSFGASSVLLYGVPHSPLAQPRNVFGGHVLSALIGVLVASLTTVPLWMAAALAVSTSIAVMQMTRTVHPPGGATALIAVIGGPKIKALGYLYVLLPVAVGALALLLVALLMNNVLRSRRYPEFWF